MKKIITILITGILGSLLIACSTNPSKNKSLNSKEIWKIDFFDDFNSFESENWQDQRIWVNNENNVMSLMEIMGQEKLVTEP